MAKEKKTIDENIDIRKIENNLKIYVDDEIKKELDKSNKRLIREKNKKILYRNILILIMCIIILFLLYLLKTVHYFDRFFIETIDTNKTEIKEEINTEEKKDEKEQLINKYKNYLDNIYVNENSIYLKDFYTGNLTIELKEYIALNSLNLETYKENGYSIIDEDTIKKSISNLFGNDEVDIKDFNYNDTDIRYINKLNSFISNKTLSNNKTNIKREIIDVSIDDYINITTVEGIVDNQNIYNIFTKEKIGKYDNNLIQNKDKLNIITYQFKDTTLVKIISK